MSSVGWVDFALCICRLFEEKYDDIKTALLSSGAGGKEGSNGVQFCTSTVGAIFYIWVQKPKRASTSLKVSIFIKLHGPKRKKNNYLIFLV